MAKREEQGKRSMVPMRGINCQVQGLKGRVQGKNQLLRKIRLGFPDSVFSFSISAGCLIRNEDIEEIHGAVSQGIGRDGPFEIAGQAENSPSHG